MQKSSGFLLAAVVALAALEAGCKDIDRFSTDPGESYCGQIVLASVVRRGFSGSVCMRMALDTRHVADRPGTLWTDDGMFLETPLRPLPELSHDPLLTFTFGEGREKNLLFAADPADTSRGPTVMAVISLMHSGNAEVRLLRGAGPLPGSPAPDAGPAGDGPPLFGVFAPLERQMGTCRNVPGCTWMPE
jgi:hypothetical protein